LAVVLSAAPAARADLADNLSNIVFEVQVSNANGSGSFAVTQDMGVFVTPEMFLWSLSGAVPILDDDENVIATLTGGTATYIGDPQIAMGFSLFAGALDTMVTIKSGLLAFPTIGNPQGLVSAGLTLTDSNGNGGTLTGPGGVLASYQYNGFVPGGTSFVDLTGSLAAGPGQSASGAANTGGFIPVGEAVSDMSFQYSFLLSAGDQASGTSNYVINAIPAPAGLALLGVCGMLGRRRRRA
jgi:MYXO-CTERM domain-containing protein